jgi:hypothetical protein
MDPRNDLRLANVVSILLVLSVGVCTAACSRQHEGAPADSSRDPAVTEPSDPSGECGAPAITGGAHTYYEALASRPECVAAFSLRKTGDLAALQGAFGNGIWNYVYPDPDYPDGYDAARLTFGGSLVPRNQLVHEDRVGEGSYTWIIDVLWTPDMRTQIKRESGVQHTKMLNIRDGRGIWFEPGHRYPTNPDELEPGQIGRHTARLYTGGIGIAAPTGFVRDGPITPPGQGATVAWPDEVTHTFRTFENTWTRFIVQVDLDLPGTAFTEWAEEYNGGQPIATWDIVASTPGPGPGETTIQLAQDHQLYYDVRPRRSDMSRVTITGHSDPALNGTWLAKPDGGNARQFVIPVAGSGGTGGATSMHYHRLSWWALDEHRNAARIIYRVPWIIRDNLSNEEDWRTANGRGVVASWDVEMNTSTSFQDQAVGFYMPEPPTIEAQTVITTPEPHGYRVGDRLAFRFSDVIPPQPDPDRAIFRVMEVISPTKVRLDWAVTTASQINVSGDAANSYGYVAKVFRAYWRNWVILKDVDLAETDSTIFQRPL